MAKSKVKAEKSQIIQSTKSIMAKEREIRRYVKKSGGFRKDLPDSDKEKAEALMKSMGREKPEWDISIIIPGYDMPEGEM